MAQNKFHRNLFRNYKWYRDLRTWLIDFRWYNTGRPALLYKLVSQVGLDKMREIINNAEERRKQDGYVDYKKLADEIALLVSFHRNGS